MTAESLVAVAGAYQTQVLALRAQAITTVGRLYDELVTGPGDAPQRAFARATARTLPPILEAAARAGIVYIPTAVRSQGGTPATAGLNAADYLTPRGVPTDEVFARPSIAIRTALAAGLDWATAWARGRSQALQYAATEPMLSTRIAVTDAMVAEPSIRGYRRVPDGGACPFCLLASTQRYNLRTNGDLMPLHPSCGCTVAPIIDYIDPGQVIDRALLKRLKDDGVIDDISRRRAAAAEAAGKPAPEAPRAAAGKKKPIAQQLGVAPVRSHTAELGPTIHPSYDLVA